MGADSWGLGGETVGGLGAAGTALTLGIFCGFKGGKVGGT